ncbi:carboxypeptidase-like regulatory domain-containing protein [Capnocytophaga canis]|uniref:carboxypeptidase-like regulatory domain-containing protein n=1 Tax=Capnocytophaga canis TaxID=1848903 RepID=UPI001F5077DD|nr:carboxypeptidase-like regulatory domain-containing protein [Capnocytophaga canis]
MKGKFLKHILIMSLCFFLQGVFAQEKEVSGVVTSSDDGMPIPAVSVIVKGTNRGVATDFDGKYTIKANEGEILQFISLGFTTVEKKVTGGVNH